jgi:CheY-like chemotaxis protein
MSAVPETASPDLPPIILLIERDRGAIEDYSRSFEDAGLWVAATRDPGEGVATAEELKPDLIVTDADGGEAADTDDMIEALKLNPELGRIPIILMTSKARTATSADAMLLKPVAPPLLLLRVRELLARAREQRARAGELVKHVDRLLARSSELLARSASAGPDALRLERNCPDCGVRLDWIERRAVGGVTYDYYRRCVHGCGLFCFDRDRSTWVKLA